GDDPRALAWLPDGDGILAATTTGAVIYDAATLEPLRRWPEPAGVSIIAVDSAGGLIAWAIPGEVQVRRSADGELAARLPIPSGTADLAFAPDGARLFGSWGERVWQWRTDSWELSEALRLQPERKAVDLAVSPDGAQLAVGLSSCEIQVFTLADASLRFTIGERCERMSNATTRAAFSLDGAQLATTTDQGPVMLWSLRDATPIRTLGGRINAPLVVMAPDGRIATPAETFRSDVRLWDPATGAASLDLRAAGGPPAGIAVSPRGDAVAASTADQNLVLWRLERPDAPLIRRGGLGRVFDPQLSADGSVFAAVSDQGTPWLDDDKALVWDLASDTRAFYQLDGQLGTATRDGAALEPASDSELRRTWRLTSGATLTARRTSADDPRGWSWSIAADGDPAAMLQAAPLTDTLRIWRDEPAAELMLALPAAPVAWAFSPDQSLAAVTDEGGSVLWRLADGAPVRSLARPPAPVRRLRFSPDGSLIEGLTYDGPQKLVFWETATGELRGIYPGVVTMDPALFSADGSLLLVDDIINTTDPATGERLGSRQSVRFLRASDGATIHVLGQVPDKTLNLALSGDGTRMVTAHYDGTIVIWGVGP
ncbi:MAG TPA: WD40 repeat domain-containing protein, partial [Herpetosiphonaceae bacterium]